MAFLRKIPEEPQLMENFQGGKGCLEAYSILNDAEEMKQKGRVFKHMVLKQGCEIGSHIHHGDCETVYVLKGHGKVRLNGELVDIGPGMVHFVDDGDEHYMINEDPEPMEFIALVLYTD